jgi:hypothetical protein
MGKADMARYRYRAHLRVELQDGTRTERLQEIRIEADDETLARSWLPTIASDMCHDAGSRWFDAPPEKVSVLAATLMNT